MKKIQQQIKQQNCLVTCQNIKIEVLKPHTTMSTYRVKADCSYGRYKGKGTKTLEKTKCARA